MFQRSWKGLYRFHFSVCPSLRRRAALWSLRIFHSIRWIFAHFINQHQPVWCVLIVFVNSKTCQNFCHFLTHVVGPTKKPPPTMIILTYDSTYNFGLGLCVFFSCDQAALWTVQSICPSLHLSVRLSHLFVKLEELHIVTARKPLIHQNQPVAQYLHKIQPCML